MSEAERASPPSSPSVAQVVPDDSFFFKDVYILVEDTSFRVWRRNFESGSQVFRDMFSLPLGPSAPEGSSREHPIVLKGITAHEFRQLLRTMFPREFGKAETLSVEEWVCVLKLSTMWEFSSIRNTAISKLEVYLRGPSNAARRLVLARRYHIDAWLLRALNELAQRLEPLTQEDFNVIGLDDFVKLAQVREQYTLCTNPDCKPQPESPKSTFGTPSPFNFASGPFGLPSAPVSPSRATYDFSKHIRQIFGLS